jgi:hypothetical protein
MDLDINLPDHGTFTNPAGQVIEFWIDKKDKTKCKILVDGVPLDGKKYLEEQEALYGKNNL